jgi:hypothetical protein
VPDCYRLHSRPPLVVYQSLVCWSACPLHARSVCWLVKNVRRQHFNCWASVWSSNAGVWRSAARQHVMVGCCYEAA